MYMYFQRGLEKGVKLNNLRNSIITNTCYICIMLLLLA